MVILSTKRIRNAKIPVAGPWITEKEIQYVTDTVTNAWYGNANMYHERFDKFWRSRQNTGGAAAYSLSPSLN